MVIELYLKNKGMLQKYTRERHQIYFEEERKQETKKWLGKI